MQSPITERVQKLRQEIAEISRAEKVYKLGAKSYIATYEHERRLQRLQEILDELAFMTEWKEP